ncbi:MAG TPA: phage/plasmid primase, P4 family [Terriglobia bacterium]|nr:phage/plasmid primase, P4 family [Terriglobia bacterium]
MTAAAPAGPMKSALTLIVSGVSVIPVRCDGSKAALIPWKDFQSRIMTEPEVLEHFKAPCGIAVIAGKVSGNLEIIDIESKAPISELRALIDEHLPGLLDRLPAVNTPSGGIHLFYRCPAFQGNQKLAMAGDGQVLIETRGEGGYVVTATSPPECHPTGRLYTRTQGSLSQIPEITPEEREILLSCCRSFNRYLREEQRPAVVKPSKGTGKRPGDDYNTRGDALALLLQHGWKIDGQANGTAYLRRPGKEKGVSASFGHVAPNTLYVFSSNAAPFDFERAYDAFGIFARLECAGDLAKAATELREQGYGDPLPIQPPHPPMPDSAHAQATRTVPADFVAERIDLTQDNVAAYFEEVYKDQLRYCQAWNQWFTWDQRWNPELTSLPFHYCRILARRVNDVRNKETAKASFAAGVERFARASRTFATTPDQWDANEWLVNMPTGTLNLQNDELYPHRREDYLTKITRLSPAEQSHPVFDRFLRDITLEDAALSLYLQRALGACLSGAIQDNFLLFWYGTGQNGKNTFGDLVAWILGDYAKVIPSETLMVDRSNSRHPTDLANLRGIRLAISSEVEEGSYFNEQRIKALTGDTMISARFMRQDFFEFRRTHKHLIYGNHRPQLRVVDPALKSRLHIVPFKAYFPPEARDPLMASKLRTEAPQILAWLIRGHSQWLEDGYLKKCSAVQQETDSYFEAQSTPEMWVAESCRVDEHCSARASELYKSYSDFKESRGERPMSQTRWGEWMALRYHKNRHGAGYVYSGLELLLPAPDLRENRRKDVYE